MTPCAICEELTEEDDLICCIDCERLMCSDCVDWCHEPDDWCNGDYFCVDCQREANE
jgi:hypothetical protein